MKKQLTLREFIKRCKDAGMTEDSIFTYIDVPCTEDPRLVFTKIEDEFAVEVKR